MTRPKEKLSGEAWVEDFPQWAVTAIGVLEILAAIGLIAPGLVNVAPALVAWAAVGLIALMIGAALVHLRRREYVIVIVNLIILAVAAFVAWGRLGDYPL